MTEANIEFYRTTLEGMLKSIKEQESEKGQDANSDAAMFLAGARYAYQNALDTLEMVRNLNLGG